MVCFVVLFLCFNERLFKPNVGQINARNVRHHFSSFSFWFNSFYFSKTISWCCILLIQKKIMKEGRKLSCADVEDVFFCVMVYLSSVKVNTVTLSFDLFIFF